MRNGIGIYAVLWGTLFWMLGTVTSVAVADDDSRSLTDRLGVDSMGFVDMRTGVRTQADPEEKDLSLGEIRLQLDLIKEADWATFEVKGDFVGETVDHDRNFDLETGAGNFDLREANVLFSPFSFMDIKAGRQILTWGTGDLLFINDLFPKDWQSFFIGRDDEYLKSPSDAVLVSLFSDWANLDIAYMPQFEPDRYIRGERLSFWNPMANARVGRDGMINADVPDTWWNDDAVAFRLGWNVGASECRLYVYDGFWPTPDTGFDPATGKARFPKLTEYGGSIRGQSLGGVLNAEFGYYDSREDRDGRDPFVANSEWRMLLGYEREVAQNFTVAAQYYVERMMNYDRYLAGLPPGPVTRDKARHTLTLRLTRLLLNQNLTLSLFTRYSPSDGDLYLRPGVKYKWTDNWLLTAGGNIFVGKDDYTFLGQFEKNTNVYIGARYSF